MTSTLNLYLKGIECLRAIFKVFNGNPGTALFENPPNSRWAILKNRKVTTGRKVPVITYSAMLVVPTLTGGNFLFFDAHLEALLI